MPWCPKCKSEYRDGFKVCADCGAELVEELPVGEYEEEINEIESEEEEAEVEEFDDYGVNDVSSKKGSIYRDSANKASDNRSSAWMLLIFGIIGLVFVGLGSSGILNISFGNTYLFYGVMGALFILFIIGGIVSMKNAKYFDQKAESENSLKTTLLEWCKDNLDADEIDGRIGAQGLSEEVLYFRRFAYIKQKMNYQFMNLDQSFLDMLIDDVIYESVFGE